MKIQDTGQLLRMHESTGAGQLQLTGRYGRHFEDNQKWFLTQQGNRQGSQTIVHICTVEPQPMHVGTIHACKYTCFRLMKHKLIILTSIVVYLQAWQFIHKCIMLI